MPAHTGKEPMDPLVVGREMGYPTNQAIPNDYVNCPYCQFFVKWILSWRSRFLLVADKNNGHVDECLGK